MGRTRHILRVAAGANFNGATWPRTPANKIRNRREPLMTTANALPKIGHSADVGDALPSHRQPSWHRTPLRSRRRVSFLSAVLIFLCCNCAIACRSPDSIERPFYESVPMATKASTIVEVLITGSATSPQFDGPAYSVAWARIIKVYKGPLKNDQSIRIIKGLSSCSDRFSLMQRGIVIGEVSWASDGVLDLRIISESVGERRRRLRNSATIEPTDAGRDR